MLNDIDVNGIVWLTDMYGNQVFKINKERVEKWVVSSSLNQPNGILVEKNRVLIASFSEGTLCSYDLEGNKLELLAEGLDMADSIVALERGESYLVSDWAGTVFFAKKGSRLGPFINLNLPLAKQRILA